MSKIKNRKSSVANTQSALDENVLKELAASPTLPGAMELCTRLSKKNRTTNSFFIENLIEKEQTVNKKLLDLEKLPTE